MIPPWLNIGPDLFMEAAKAGDQMSNAMAAREQQARDTAAKQNFMYDELRQHASEGEAGRQVQYAGLANQQYEANLRANQANAHLQQQMQMEDARRRDQGYERAMTREDRFNQNAIANKLAQNQFQRRQDEFAQQQGLRGAANTIRGQELLARQNDLNFRSEKNKAGIKNLESLFEMVRKGRESGKTYSQIYDAFPEVGKVPGFKEAFAREQRPKTAMQELFGGDEETSPTPSNQNDSVVPVPPLGTKVPPLFPPLPSDTNAPSRFKVVYDPPTD